MTALWLVAWLLAGPLSGETLRVADEPRRVCIEAPRAVFQIENAGEAPVLVVLSVERWGGGDAEDWSTVQEDVTQREATAKKGRSVKLEAGARRDVFWVLKGRKGPPLATGRHRLVASFTDKDGRPAGRIIHEFALTDCSD